MPAREDCESFLLPWWVHNRRCGRERVRLTGPSRLRRIAQFRHCAPLTTDRTRCVPQAHTTRALSTTTICHSLLQRLAYNVTAPNCKATQFQYDGSGDLTEQTEALGYTTTYA